MCCSRVEQSERLGLEGVEVAIREDRLHGRVADGSARQRAQIKEVGVRRLKARGGGAELDNRPAARGHQLRAKAGEGRVHRRRRLRLPARFCYAQSLFVELP